MTAIIKKKAPGNWCTIRSKSKMIVWFLDGSATTNFSFLALDRKSRNTGIDQLERLLFSNKPMKNFPNGYKGLWKSAIIYDNQQLRGPELRRWVDGQRVYD
ncbi:MAG: hypothetical protein ACI8ZM_002483 [Crocinitomix sp.]|jgi:hypothetical protein